MRIGCGSAIRAIILADADSDGLHIATLLSALFLKHFTALVETGHVASFREVPRV